MSPTLRKHLLGGASASVLLLAAAAPAAAQAPRYAAGDFHNHTTCTDGVVSTKAMIGSVLSLAYTNGFRLEIPGKIG